MSSGPSGSLARRATRVRRVLGRPENVVLAVRMAGWAAALPLLKRTLPLPRLVELTVRRRRPGRSAGPDLHTVATLASWIYRVPGKGDNCLERSLLTFRYLPAAARPYSLVLGVRRRGAAGPPGHAWLLAAGEPVHDTPESLARFAPVLVFDASGRRQAASEAEPASVPDSGHESRAEPHEQQDGPPGPHERKA